MVKLHMRFRLALRLMTLNCYKFEFSLNSACFADLEGNNSQTNEDRPILSATEF